MKALPIRHIPGTYQRDLFDPVQTHAVYGLTDLTLPGAKEDLKKAGGTRFRTVKVKASEFRILCYKSK